MSITSERSWIFMRGLVRGQGHWGDFPEKFALAFPKDRFEMIDIPGNGERCDEASPLCVDDYVNIMRSRSLFVQARKKVNVLAISLGGMIATRWMQLYPQDFLKLFLVCTSSRSKGSFYERLRPENYFEILGLLWPHTAEKYEKKVLAMTMNNVERVEWLLPQLARYTDQHRLKRLNFIRQLVAASLYSFPEKIPGDIKVIGSYGDQLVAPTCSLRIAKGWGVEAVMHPSAGHDIPVDEPSWLLEQLS